MTSTSTPRAIKESHLSHVVTDDSHRPRKSSSTGLQKRACHMLLWMSGVRVSSRVHMAVRGLSCTKVFFFPWLSFTFYSTARWKKHINITATRHWYSTTIGNSVHVWFVILQDTKMSSWSCLLLSWRASCYKGLGKFRISRSTYLLLVAFLNDVSKIVNELKPLHDCGFSFGDFNSMKVLIFELPNLKSGKYLPNEHENVFYFGR